jgi:predicted DNA-binding transcriptional regulator AlpA
MSIANQRRATRATNLVNFPPDYPNLHRFQNTDFFRGALFGVSRAAFYNYLNAGLIPPPDAKHGHRNAWRETTIASAVEAFAARSVTA